MCALRECVEMCLIYELVFSSNKKTWNVISSYVTLKIRKFRRACISFLQDILSFHSFLSLFRS